MLGEEAVGRALPAPTFSDSSRLAARSQLPLATQVGEWIVTPGHQRVNRHPGSSTFLPARNRPVEIGPVNPDTPKARRTDGRQISGRYQVA